MSWLAIITSDTHMLSSQWTLIMLRVCNSNSALVAVVIHIPKKVTNCR